MTRRHDDAVSSPTWQVGAYQIEGYPVPLQVYRSPRSGKLLFAVSHDERGERYTLAELRAILATAKAAAAELDPLTD